MQKMTIRELEERVDLGAYYTTQRIIFKDTMPRIPGRGTLHRDVNGYPVSDSESNVIKRGIAEKTFHFSTFSITFKEAFEKGCGDVHHFYINIDAVTFEHGEKSMVVDGVFIYNDDFYDAHDEDAVALTSRSDLYRVFSAKHTAIDYSAL